MLANQLVQKNKKNQLRFFLKNIKLLSFLKLKLTFKKVSTIVWFGLLIAITIAINISGLFILNSGSGNELNGVVLLLKSLQSTYLFIYTVYFVIAIFKKELSNNVHTLELRYGFKVRELFISRIISSLTIILSAYLIVLLINISFGLPSAQLFRIFTYKLYISSLAWYIIVMMIGYSLTIFFVSFFSSTLSTILSILMLFLLLVGGAIGSIFSTVGFNMNINIISPRDIFLRKRDQEIKRSFDAIDPSILTYSSRFFEKVILVDNEESSIIVRNKSFFGPKGWKDLKDLGQENPEFSALIEMYDYFTNYFNENTFAFSFSDVVGLIDDKYQQKAEPLGILLGQIIKNVDAKYENLIQTLFKLNRDSSALKTLGINFNWNLDYNGYITESPSYLLSFLFERDIFAGEILFYKLLTQSLSISDINFIEQPSVVNSTKNYIEVQQRNLLFNPLVQFSVLFNSVNYSNFGLDQAINDVVVFLSVINYTNDNYDANLENIVSKRVFNPELIYVIYFIISCLIIFGSYFQFKRKLVSGRL